MRNRWACHVRGASMEIPIIDASRKIVGWTADDPEYSGGLLRHAKAERLLRGPIACTYLEIPNPLLQRRAGAPAGWSEPGQSLEICSAGEMVKSPWDPPPPCFAGRVTFKQ